MVGRKGRGVNRVDKQAISIVAVIAVVLLLVILALSIPMIFLNYKDLRINEVRTVPMEGGVEDATILFRGNRGHLNVTFEELNGSMVQLEATIVGKVGFFGNTNPLTMLMTHSVDGTTLVVNASIDTYGPWPFYTLSRINYDLKIDESLKSDLNISITTGGILLNATAGSIISGMHLEATSSGIEVNLDNSSVSGEVFIKSATGGTELLWKNVSVTADTSIQLRESSGSIVAAIYQATEISGNVTLKADATAGAISFSLHVGNGFAASIFSGAGVGGLDVVEREGFVGEDSALHTANYPTERNFDATLNTTVGGITVVARQSIN